MAIDSGLETRDLFGVIVAGGVLVKRNSQPYALSAVCAAFLLVCGFFSALLGQLGSPRREEPLVDLFNGTGTACLYRFLVYTYTYISLHLMVAIDSCSTPGSSC